MATTMIDVSLSLIDDCNDTTTNKHTSFNNEDRLRVNTSSTTTTPQSSNSISSTSLSSLFERVTNFRRSLIQHRKKDKSRPSPSSSFSLFNKLTSTSQQLQIKNNVINDDDIADNDHHHNNNDDHSSADNNNTMAISIHNTPTINHNDIITLHHANTINNNDGHQNGCGDDVTTSFMSSTMVINVDEEDAIYGFTAINLNNPSKPRRQLLTKQAIASSTSLVTNSKYSNNKELPASSSSLYETIAECNEPSTTNASTHQQQHHHHHHHHTPTESSNWKNKRRSSVSVLLFGGKNNNGDDAQQKQAQSQNVGSAKSYRHSSYYSAAASSTAATAIEPACHRSSDDILIKSTASTTKHFKSKNNKNGNIIYENVKSQTSNHYYHRHTNHNIFADPTRKLTKDSGYESSSSTLVSVSRTSTTTSSNHHSSMINMISSTGYGVLNRSNVDMSSNRQKMANQMAQNHSKSDSIDSNLSHESFDSINDRKHCSPSSSSATIDSPEILPIDAMIERIEQDSPPPTPPIRHSSLPENYVGKMMANTLEQSPIIINNHSNDHWSYNLYPKMRHKKQMQQQEEHEHDANVELSLSNNKHQSLSMIKNDKNNNSHKPIIIHQDAINNSGSQSLKEIQKRAVYEFYLRIKEKRNRSIINEVSSTAGVVNIQQQNNGQIVNDQDKFKDTKMVDDPPTLINSHHQIINQSSINNDFPPPPSPSLPQSSSTQTIDGQIETISEQNETSNHQSLLSSLYLLFKRFGLDLKLFWPTIDLSQLIPMLIVVFNIKNDDTDDQQQQMVTEFDDEDDIKIKEELQSIHQMNGHKNRLTSRLNLLQMESNRIRKNLFLFEQKIGQFIRTRLTDESLQNKMDLLCSDIQRIIALIFSLHQQIKNVDHNHLNSNCMNGIIHNNNNNNDKYSYYYHLDNTNNDKNERLSHLNRQLNEAYKLCLAIEQRCTLFINRLSSYKHLFNDNNHHHMAQWSTTEQLIMTIINDNNIIKTKHHLINHESHFVVHEQQNDCIIRTWIMETMNNMANDDDDNNRNFDKFKQLIQSYLKHLQSLYVQINIIDSLIHYYQQQS